jgi:hypothetical protein
MLKKILISISLIILFCVNSSSAEVFQYVGQEFDWNTLSQQEKTERVNNIFKLMFPTGQISNWSKKEFKSQFKSHLKDADTSIHYDAVVAGYKEYKNVNLEPFYYKNTDCIYLYALQYKNDLSKTYYYNLFGKLKFVDIRYGDYVNCPCYIKKYDANGKLKRSAYVQDKDIIYVYGSKGEFEGVQFKGVTYKY